MKERRRNKFISKSLISNFMKHLFIVRHGNYGMRDLTESGISQIEQIAKDIRRIVGKNYSGYYLLSSTAPRAEQTADIIAKAFGIEQFDKDIRLWTRDGNDLSLKNLEEIDGMIAPHKEKHDIVTIVTHEEVVLSYPRYCLKQLLNIDKQIGYIDKGKGIHLNLERKTYQFLPVR